MYKLNKFKLLSAFVLTIIALLVVAPNLMRTKSSWLPSDKINLGLDLKGGAHLLLHVDFDSYLQDVTRTSADSVKKTLRTNKIGYKNFRVVQKSFSLTLRNTADKKEATRIIKSIDPNLSISGADDNLSVYYNEYAINQLQDKVVDQSIEIIRMRVDSSGTKEPNIQRQGTLNILLQVPGVDDPQSLKRVLGKTAKLSFHQVAAGNEEKNMDRKTRVVHSADGRESLPVIRKSIISGEHLNDANVRFQHGVPVVHFSLNHVGAKLFGDFTKNNRGRRLAIILDSQLLKAPNIDEPILTGDGIISGDFTIESASELALMLRAGALPAPLKIIEERTVGPNLGADSIQAGKVAAAVGFALVVVFMVLAYGVLGIFSGVTLVLALLYLFALLTLLQATLTLPGIAGIILTIGMAVDANVLIYERIKEEIEQGASNLYAVKVGFESAFTTIIDSNVTTLIAAFLLYSFGVGAIKGFAVTLTMGIIASMYSALVVTRLMIDAWLVLRKPVQKII